MNHPPTPRQPTNHPTTRLFTPLQRPSHHCNPPLHTAPARHLPDLTPHPTPPVSSPDATARQPSPPPTRPLRHTGRATPSRRASPPFTRSHPRQPSPRGPATPSHQSGHPLPLRAAPALPSHRSSHSLAPRQPSLRLLQPTAHPAPAAPSPRSNQQVRAKTLTGALSASTAGVYTRDVATLVELPGEQAVLDDLTGADVDAILLAFARKPDGRTAGGRLLIPISPSLKPAPHPAQANSPPCSSQFPALLFTPLSRLPALPFTLLKPVLHPVQAVRSGPASMPHPPPPAARANRTASPGSPAERLPASPHPSPPRSAPPHPPRRPAAP
ncbi:hypothetical protein SAMN05444920_105239 [Nonomuraea solani]|uniref:Uncharacterized protein n=1 Tax=Nonomuraea solani TaxID=1144553 RepID=A0A1H6DGD5_9ACTN|nr:hypothetical protein SAMN05444920_105239 [Nonomuraea solani]